MTEGYCCQTIEINVPNTSPLNFSFKSLITVLVLFLFLNKTPFPPWSSSENSKYHRGTKPKAGMDDFFYYSFENSFSNTDEWPASAFKKHSETKQFL